MMSLVFLSWRNFSRNLNRYRVLFLALLVVVSVFTLTLGIVQGITNSLYEKASRYFSGDIAIQQFGVISILMDPEAVESLLDRLQLPVQRIVRRSVYYETNQAQIFFGGRSVIQRRLVGVEWESEYPHLSQLTMADGAVPSSDDPYGVLVSTVIADQLGVHVGDEVLITLNTLTGQRNTGFFIVRGIFAESSFFGYTAYLDREALNILTNVPPTRVNEIGIYLNHRRDQIPVSNQIWQALEPLGPRLPVLQTREQRARELAPGTAEPTLAVLTLDAQLAEIKDLIDAIFLLATGIIGLFAILVMIGVANTYSLLVYERTKEIGTLRAIGMVRSRVTQLFLLESFWLGILGALLGLFLGISLLQLVSNLFDFSGNSWAELFLSQGRLVWSLSFNDVLLISLVSVFSSVIGSSKAARRAASLTPVDALRQE